MKKETIMPGTLHHETFYRGRQAMERLGAVSMTLCGAGALGSQLADNLVRQGVRHLRVIDQDRIEEHNVGTQLYGLSDVGGLKAEVLRNRLFKATGVEIEAVAKELTERNASKLLRGSELVVDAFDNARSRQFVQEACRADGLPALHVGLAADYAEVIWDPDYRVPTEGELDTCDYPLARNLVLLAVAVASETVCQRLLEGIQRNWSLTLRDLSIQPLEARAD